MIDTWIKIFRKFKEWEWYQNSNTKDVFLEILLTANFENKRWQGIEIKRGQLVTSIQNLFLALNKNSKNPDISTQNIRTALSRLKSTNEITMDTTTKYTLITVVKYNDYQQSTSEITNDQQTTNKRPTTTKEYNNIKIKKIINIYNSFESITEQDIIEIAEKYSIDIFMVRKKLTDVKGWEDEKPGRMKGRNWKATLMNWIRKDIDNGKIRKRIKLPQLIQENERTSEEKEKALKKLEEIKKNNPLFVSKFLEKNK